MKNIKRAVFYFGILITVWFIFTFISINNFSYQYFEIKSDVAIVLGAGSSNRELSAVFKERINHGVRLFKSKKVKYIIFTGGFGKNETISDSKVAMLYAIKKGVPKESIMIEEKSTITYENLKEANQIMKSKHLKTALIVSDPIHMKRAIKISKKMGIKCESSPTQTSMYKSWKTKIPVLLYESFYYNVDFIEGHL